MKFEFNNNNGERLLGRLEMPTEKPKAFAIFAHCFTCTAQISATTVISRKLTEYGIATLRFDFTGLGNSGGDFSNSNFSSNVEDIICAFQALEKKYTSPTILIGHSLGGAAVLRAATKLTKIKSVITIGAPSSIEHVSNLFKNDIPEINKKGEASVNLAGRRFTIKKQFLNDIFGTHLLDGLSELRKSFLIMHSPLDQTVSIDHAGKIFQTLMHPKSFISLDDANHLVTNKNDAEYIATLISSWLIKSLPKELNNEQPRPKINDNEVIVKSNMSKDFTQNIYTKDHHLLADEPISFSGDNLGPTPYQYLLAALGSCTAITVKMYADRKKINLKNISVNLVHNKVNLTKSSKDAPSEEKTDQIIKTISFSGDYSHEQKKRIMEIAERCPVNRTLKSEIDIISREN